MRVKCEACNGHGRWTDDHANNPVAEIVDCEPCEGTGTREATAKDLDGLRAKYIWAEGSLHYERMNNSLTLCTDDDYEIVNLQPEHLELVA